HRPKAAPCALCPETARSAAPRAFSLWSRSLPGGATGFCRPRPRAGFRAGLEGTAGLALAPGLETALGLVAARLEAAPALGGFRAALEAGLAAARRPVAVAPRLVARSL